MKTLIKQLGIGLGVLALVSWFTPVGFAQATDSAAAIPDSFRDAISQILTAVSFILQAMYALLIPILGLIGKFLSNDWVTGSAFNMDQVIDILWAFVRNLVNITIVLYILFLAGRSILPFGGNDKFALKSKLPLAIAALIVVNFSLFFSRTILSFSNMATSMAFSIPQTVTGPVLDNTIGSIRMFIWSQPIGASERGSIICRDLKPPTGSGEASAEQKEEAKYFAAVRLSNLTSEQQNAIKDFVSPSTEWVCQLAAKSSLERIKTDLEAKQQNQETQKKLEVIKRLIDDAKAAEPTVNASGESTPAGVDALRKVVRVPVNE